MPSQQGRAIFFRDLSLTPPKGTTQADRIPDDLPDTIPGLPFLLRGWSDFPKWEFQVRLVLENLGLQDLVDRDLSRPEENHKNYIRWHSCSKRLQIWLTRQLSGEVMEEFVSSVDDKDFADEAYKVIRRIVLGHGVVRCQNVAYKLVRMTRADYSTAGQYIENFKNIYILAKQLQCGLPPFTASLLMLREILHDIPTWVAMIEQTMPADAGSTYTDNDFFTLCRNAIEQSQR